MFVSAGLKVARAEKLISEIESQFDKFISKHQPSLNFITHDGSYRLQIIVGQSIPSDFSTLIGDAVHNLRTSLDHLVWELMEVDGGVQDRYTKFITGNNQRNFETSCEGVKTPRPDTILFLKSLAVFPGGSGEALYILNDLDISDKHKTLTPVVGIVNIRHLKMCFRGGGVMSLGGAKFEVDDKGYSDLVKTGLPFESIKVDGVPKFEIVFGDAEGVARKPIIDTLRQMLKQVSATHKAFEAFVKLRS